MKVYFEKLASKQYIYWKDKDIKVFNKINSLLLNIKITPYSGLGKPEALKNNLSGYWSRRITEEHRLVYRIEDDLVIVVQCRYHY